MDALDRVLESGRDLLYRVDSALTVGGAPPEAPIWALLRRTGALPGDALEFAAGLDVAALHAAADELRAHGAEFVHERAAVDELVAAEPWQGSGADVFNAQWRALSAFIGDGVAADQPSLTGRLRALTSYVDSLARWAEDLRGTLAMTIAEALISAEAVTLKAAPPMSFGAPAAQSSAVIEAAATIGTRVLDALVEVVRVGHDLHDEWAPWLSELHYTAPAEAGPTGYGTTTRVEL
jgi:hypothetical protein